MNCHILRLTVVVLAAGSGPAPAVSARCTNPEASLWNDLLNWDTGLPAAGNTPSINYGVPVPGGTNTFTLSGITINIVTADGIASSAAVTGLTPGGFRFCRVTRLRL